MKLMHWQKLLKNVLKNGVEISNRKIELMYTKPATDFNRDLNEKYENNYWAHRWRVLS